MQILQTFKLRYRQYDLVHIIQTTILGHDPLSVKLCVHGTNSPNGHQIAHIVMNVWQNQTCKPSTTSASHLSMHKSPSHTHQDLNNESYNLMYEPPQTLKEKDRLSLEDIPKNQIQLMLGKIKLHCFCYSYYHHSFDS